MAGRKRDISSSMVALVLSLAALALLGLVTNVPAWLGRDSGFADVGPGCCRSTRRRQGSRHPRRRGHRVALRRRACGSAARTTSCRDRDRRLDALGGRRTGVGRPAASPWRTSSHRYDNVRITELLFLPGRATYFGTVERRRERACRSTLRVELAGPVVRIGVGVPRAAPIVWHLDREPPTVGIRPVLPFRQPAPPRVLGGPPTQGARPPSPRSSARSRRRAAPGGPRRRHAVDGPHRRARLVRRRRADGVVPGRSPSALTPSCRGTRGRLDMGCCERLGRVAMLSVHTSPLEQPGTGDAGGHERLRRRGGAPARPPRRRGRDLHPDAPPPTSPPVGRAGARACWSAT